MVLLVQMADADDLFLRLTVICAPTQGITRVRRVGDQAAAHQNRNDVVNMPGIDAL